MELQRKNVIISILIPIIAAFLLFFLKNSLKASPSGCSLLDNTHYWISSKRIVTPNGIISGAVEIKDGKVISIVKEEQWRGITKQDQIVDFGEAVVMPGLVDVHAHLDDPGRDEWEGFPSGTRAAAAGGITTLIDMPLNSEPSTVSVETLNLKIKAAKNRIFVDVGFWGGLVPENAFNATALENFLRAGVLGLKSFMCPSGIDDFPMTNISHIKVIDYIIRKNILIFMEFNLEPLNSDFVLRSSCSFYIRIFYNSCHLTRNLLVLKEGLSMLAKFKRPLLVHAEIQEERVEDLVENNDDDPRLYSTYLKTRPPSM
ncbi:hypothetical protein KSS87_000145 [Heliosperma pusillum]|nr:hypothetical protein KSS87_000145 [Heliosperma pusillum]